MNKTTEEKKETLQGKLFLQEISRGRFARFFSQEYSPVVTLHEPKGQKPQELPVLHRSTNKGIINKTELTGGETTKRAIVSALEKIAKEKGLTLSCGLVDIGNGKTDIVYFFR